MQCGQDNTVCLESFKTLGENNTTRGDERLAYPFWLWSWDFPTFTWWEQELLEVAESSTHIIFNVSTTVFFLFPADWSSGDKVQFFTFFFLSLVIHSFWINTVCAMNISLGWLGFYSQGKVAPYAWFWAFGMFLCTYVLRAHNLWQKFYPTSCDQSLGCDLQCNGTLGSFVQLGRNVLELFIWHLALLSPGS